MFNRTILLAGLALAGACFGSSAQAQSPTPDDSMRQEHVSFRDLDLTGPAGAKTLMIRLHRAANDVCGRWDGSFDLPTQAAADACVQVAVARAVRQINQPMLTALLDTQPAMQVASIARPGR